MLLVCSCPFPADFFVIVGEMDIHVTSIRCPKIVFGGNLDTENLRPMKSIACEPGEAVLQVFNLSRTLLKNEACGAPRVSIAPRLKTGAALKGLPLAGASAERLELE